MGRNVKGVEEGVPMRVTGERVTRVRRLDRERILATALALLDAEGIEHLSMRRLAAELGVEAMSLYNHVPSKAALLEGVAELILAEIELPGPGAAETMDWRDRLRGGARSLRRVALAHPSAVMLLMAQPLHSPTALEPIELALATLRSAGFGDQATVYAFHTLTGFVFGQVLQELHGPFAHPDGEPAAHLTLTPEQFPAVCALGELAAGRDLEAEFEFGLTAVLDGMAAALPAHD
jgi:AcrR family transcriptional regulator